MRSARLLVLVASVVLLIGAVTAALLWRHPELLGVRAGSEEQSTGLLWVATLSALALLLLTVYRLFGNDSGRKAYRDESADDAEPVVQSETRRDQADSLQDLKAIREHMRSQYGAAWRLKVRLLLVVGEENEVDAIAPGLVAARWLAWQDFILLYGGRALMDGAVGVAGLLKELRPSRPLDGIVWAVTEDQTGEAGAIGNGVRQLQVLAGNLRWQAPLYLWQVRRCAWSQEGRASQSVGCLLSPGATGAQIETALRQLVTPLREQGLAQMDKAPEHDFLLRLSRDLEHSGIAQWRAALAPLLSSFARGVPLRGLLFGEPQTPVSPSTLEHSWWPAPAWDVIREDRQARGRTFGWTWQRGAQVAALGLAGICVLALLLSFIGNRNQIATVEAALATIGQPGDLDAQLTGLGTLTRELAQLEHQRDHGVPWYRRFGLSQNDALLAASWPRFADANNRLMRDATASSLASLASLPPSDPEQALTARDQLKAYLMMANPEKADAGFLAKVLAAATADRSGVTPALWQASAPGLWTFYAQHLQAHPDWRIEPRGEVIAQARKALFGQLDQPSVEDGLYRQLLEQANNQYVALGLPAMLGETSAATLFDTPDSVPGAFTRQAWEGYLRTALDQAAETRREELDWVLSDPQHPLALELQPEALKARLSERYFQDFSAAWLDVLNSIRWHKAASQAEAIGQLALLGDTRQSPLVALMNTLAYQGMAGLTAGPDKDPRPRAEQDIDLRAPMEQVFGPVLALLGKGDGASPANEQASLQTYLVRLARTRTKLQQINNAPDPQAMTQALARSTFQGRGIDNQDYGQVIATSLGPQWREFAQNLFVQPLGQAWTGVLQPSVQQLNRQWQQTIVSDWQRNFAGRYPFSASGGDASLPLLGQMIRADTGRIDQFIANQLGGVLRKEGQRWVVAESANSQGLRINPAFLTAVNQLGALASTLYSDGAMGLSFELRAKPVRDLVRTRLVIDGEALEYFNQVESWQAFTWPSQNDHPGTLLTWDSVNAGARLYGNYAGPWGLIRLLEKATVTSLGGTAYQLVLVAPDGIPLTWQMRARKGSGPLALLKLRDFKLPQEILQAGAVTEAAFGMKER